MTSEAEPAPETDEAVLDRRAGCPGRHVVGRATTDAERTPRAHRGTGPARTRDGTHRRAAATDRRRHRADRRRRNDRRAGATRGARADRGSGTDRRAGATLGARADPTPEPIAEPELIADPPVPGSVAPPRPRDSRARHPGRARWSHRSHPGRRRRSRWRHLWCLEADEREPVEDVQPPSEPTVPAVPEPFGPSRPRQSPRPHLRQRRSLPPSTAPTRPSLQPPRPSRDLPWCRPRPRRPRASCGRSSGPQSRPPHRPPRPRRPASSSTVLTAFLVLVIVVGVDRARQPDRVTLAETATCAYDWSRQTP